MYNKRFVPDVYHTADAVAGVEGGTSSRVVLHRTVVVAVLNFLGKNRESRRLKVLVTMQMFVY